MIADAITPGLAFDAEAHEYTLDGEPIAGVSRLLERYGLISGAFHDDAAAERGTALHSAIALDNSSAGFDEERFMDERPDLAGRWRAYRRFMRENPEPPLAVEVPLADRRYSFGGTVDRIMAGVDRRLEIRRQLGWHQWVQMVLYKRLVIANCAALGMTRLEAEGLALHRIRLADNGLYRIDTPDPAERADAERAASAILALHEITLRRV